MTDATPEPNPGDTGEEPTPAPGPDDCEQDALFDDSAIPKHSRRPPDPA